MSIDTLSPHEEIARQEEARGLELLREQAMKDLIVSVSKKAEGRGGLEAVEQSERLDAVNGILRKIGGQEIGVLLASSASMEDKRKRVLSLTENTRKGAEAIVQGRKNGLDYALHTKDNPNNLQEVGSSMPRSCEQRIKDSVRGWSVRVKEGKNNMGAEAELFYKDPPSDKAQCEMLMGALAGYLGEALQAQETKEVQQALGILEIMGVINSSSTEKEITPLVGIFSEARGGMPSAEEQSKMDTLVKPLGLLWDTKKGAYQKL